MIFLFGMKNDIYRFYFRGKKFIARTGYFILMNLIMKNQNQKAVNHFNKTNYKHDYKKHEQ